MTRQIKDITFVTWHKFGFYAHENMYDCREVFVEDCPWGLDDPKNKLMDADKPMWPSSWEGKEKEAPR